MGNTLSLILQGYIYPFDYWVKTLDLSLIKFQRKGTVFFQLPIEKSLEDLPGSKMKPGFHSVHPSLPFSRVRILEWMTEHGEVHS